MSLHLDGGNLFLRSQSNMENVRDVTEVENTGHVDGSGDGKNKGVATADYDDEDCNGNYGGERNVH